ncbi:MAG: hypothetical protein WBI53_06845, partial [Paludibacter sp.]
RGGFFKNTTTINGQTYQANWYSDTQNVMTKDANNLFSFQIFLPWSQDESTAFTYKYTDVFKGQGTTGPRLTGDRKFTLTQDRMVNFYAKAWYNTTSSIYQTQMICDAQKVSFLFYPTGTMTSFTQELPLPVNGKSAVAITIPATATSKVEYNVYDESTIPSPFAWGDLNNNATNYKQTLCQSNKSGRYILMVDYPTITATTSKVLDGINTPLIKIGSGAFVDPAASTFSGANLGTFNITTPLNISGSLNAYSTNSAVNVSDVSAKLYYQITKTGYDSGVKEVVLTNGGSTIQTGSVFTNATALDITTGLENGDYTLNVWYGTTNQTDVLLLDNSGNKYTSSFSVNNISTEIFNPLVGAKITTENGTLNANFDKVVELNLYSISGLLLNHTTASEFSKELKAGVYILKVNGKAQKVVIK